MKPKISMIAIIDEHRALGKDNKLLWDIPEDLERFRKITKGHAVVMGRKTYESIGRPLPNRLNIIVTRSGSIPRFSCASPFGRTQATLQNGYLRHGHTIVCNSLEDAIKVAKERLPDKKEIFIIGGGQIYNEAMKYTDKLYLTIVEGKYKADTFFPDYCEFKKKVFEKKGKSGKYTYKFVDLEK
ncbi:MAG: dihydrofolate reductase [Candidatus Roizmanbacteria bacterium]|nr:MAG: dihydrofolate reductase [Candidatus Roizmanbacteria bacterium]